MFRDVQLITMRYTRFITFCFALSKTKIMSKYLVCFDTSKNQVKQSKIRKGLLCYTTYYKNILLSYPSINLSLLTICYKIIMICPVDVYCIMYLMFIHPMFIVKPYFRCPCTPTTTSYDARWRRTSPTPAVGWWQGKPAVSDSGRYNVKES